MSFWETVTKFSPGGSALAAQVKDKRTAAAKQRFIKRKRATIAEKGRRKHKTPTVRMRPTATSQPVPVRRPFSTRDTPQTAAQHATAEADDEITDAELSAMSVPAGVGGLSPMVLIIGGVVILGGAYFLLSRKSASKSKAA